MITVTVKQIIDHFVDIKIKIVVHQEISGFQIVIILRD